MSACLRNALPVMTRALALRARVVGSPEAPFDRLWDPVTADLLAGGPVASERFAARWTDAAALKNLADAKRAPLDPALAREMAEQHRRLGASPASLAATI